MNSFAQFITVLLIFIIVLIVTYAVTKWIGGIQKTQSRSGSIEVIESARIAPGVYIEIVRIGKKYVALSVSKDASSYICDVPYEDICLNEGGTSGALNFEGIFNMMKGKFDVKEDSDISGKDRDE